MIGKIFELKRFAVHDGDGIRTTVFFKGCPLRCVWCHNPEGLSHRRQEAFYPRKCVGCGACKREGFSAEACLGEARVVYGKDVTMEELLPLLLEDKEFFDNSNGGVTLSGGECLAQADFCAELLRELKKSGVRTAVDTCGFVAKEALDKVLPHTDVFLYDLKAYDEEVHIRCTGQSNEIILKNLIYLDSLGKETEIRIPYVPGFNDGQTEKIARFLKPLRHIRKIRLLPYHNYAGSKYEALGLPCTLPATLPTEEELQRARTVLQSVTGVSVHS